MGFASTYTRAGHEERCPDINGPACAAHPVDEQWHDLGIYYADVRARVEYGLTDWLSLDVMWSLRIVKIDFELQDLARRPIDAPYGEEIHHRDETLVGPTDPWLTLRVLKRLGPWSFAWRAGVTLPIGSTVENPFALGRAGRAHQHIQLGSGTVDPVVEVEVRRAVGRFEVSPWLLARVPLYENRHGYRLGAQLFAGLRAASDLWTRRVDFLLGVLAYHEQPERWSGAVETEGNLGRTDVMLETTIGVRLPRGIRLIFGGRAPLFSKTTGAQLTTPAIGDLMLSVPFRL